MREREREPVILDVGLSSEHRYGQGAGVLMDLKSSTRIAEPL